MAEADDDSISHDEEGAKEEDGESASPVDTGDFSAAALKIDGSGDSADESASDTESDAKEEDEDPKKTGPGFIVRSIRWLIRWHPVLFLSLAVLLALYAWSVYPKQEERTIPAAESFYYDGLDRLYRVINPDLPLVAATPADEALAARNALLNLFVFYRNAMREYPSFINPSLLLAEANRILAEYNPAMATKYWDDALAAYGDAAAWEGRNEDPERMTEYINANFLEGKGSPNDPSLLDPANDEVVLRRQRRADYITYRTAEANVNLDRPDVARTPLEDLRKREDGRRREESRLSSRDEGLDADIPRHAFELGPDEFRRLDLLLARTYDGLEQLDRAKSWYLRYLSPAPEGRSHAFVIERLANIAMSDGVLYQKVNPAQSTKHFEDAAQYYRQLISLPSVSKVQHDNAVLGLATANTRLADLVPESQPVSTDDLSALGRTVRQWLEEFSGQQLPRRTLVIPVAVGKTLAKPELAVPTPAMIPAMAGGNLSAMAGGEVTTPHERRRLYLAEAVENYDRIAASKPGTSIGDRAAFLAAQESWKLGRKKDTEARLERMLDPLSSPDLIMAARASLARIALDRGDLRRAYMLILGGYAHPLPVWFDSSDADWQKFASQLGIPASRENPGIWRRIWQSIPDEGREIAGYAASGRRLDSGYISRLLRNLNAVLRRPDFYTREDFPPSQNRNAQLSYILDKNPELLTDEDVAWRNRLLFEEAFPYDLVKRGSKDTIGFDPLPVASALPPASLADPNLIRDVLIELANAWSNAAATTPDQSEKLRMLLESNTIFQAALDKYNADPGEILYELAHNYEELADIREQQGKHIDALSLTAEAARDYLDVSFKAQGSPRERESLLSAGDAFFRAGLLERTVESQRRFLDRFGYASYAGSDQAMEAVRAENLLGRAYWFLGDSNAAIDSFRQNISRRTPDRYKSMYYIGRILMEEGVAQNNPELLGYENNPLPKFDRNGDPVITSALQAFNFLRQSPDINPTARAWRWATFDLARLRFIFAERARFAAQNPGTSDENDDTPAPEPRPWLSLYDDARQSLLEALERYPIHRTGTNANTASGLSVRIEPEDYADVMTARFESEYMLAQTLLTLAEAGQDENLYALGRVHLENMRDRHNYASALFNPNYDRFQLNSAIIREEIEGPNLIERAPLPRTRLGDDEGPSRSPERLRDMLKNAMQLLGNEFFRAGERIRERQRLASSETDARMPPDPNLTTFYQDSYQVWQDFYDRFGVSYGPQSMVMMGDNLSRMGHTSDAANHYRMARNMADLLPENSDSDDMIALAPAFWGTIAAQRLKDLDDGYSVP